MGELKNKERVNITLEKEMAERLRNEAEPMSSVIATALEMYYDKAPQGFAYEVRTSDQEGGPADWFLNLKEAQQFAALKLRAVQNRNESHSVKVYINYINLTDGSGYVLTEYK